MPNLVNCATCGSQGTFRPITGMFLDYTCPRCGNYTITGSAETMLRKAPIENVGAVSGWIRRQNATGISPKIDSDVVPRLRALTKPPFQERVEQYLLAAAESLSRLDASFEPGTDKFIGVSYSDDSNELKFVLDYLIEEGLMLAPQLGFQPVRLSPKGYITADELRARRAATTQAFVAMWFSDETSKVYPEAIEPAIRSAGYSPMLISNKEHSNKIDDEIIAEIRRSAFLVADFTGHRQNVYFETGFAIGLARQVIWTCRKDHIAELHFDIRQYNCINWQDPTELAQRLQRRIEAMFGRGPLAPS